MLLQRVITALALLPLVLGAAWYAPLPWLYGLLAVAALLAAWEWTTLMGWGEPAMRGRRHAYLVACAAVMGLGWLLRGYWPWFAGLAVAWWLLASFVLPGFPANLERLKPGALSLGLLGQVWWAPTVLSLVMLRAMPDGGLRLIYVLSLVWAADVGAYLAGRNFGRHKLAPNISPGKTREGALGGLLLCAAWALTAGSLAFKVIGLHQLLLLLALSLLAAALSIVGDLSISMFKRLSGVKDSGTLLPGHGGLLDRIDALLFVGPWIYLWATWVQ